MQAAFARTRRVVHSPFREGRSLLLSLSALISLSLLRLSGKKPNIRENPNETPLALVALLLFTLPSPFTLQKFVVFDASGERSHHHAARL